MSRAPKTGLFSGKSNITAFFFIFFAALIAFAIGVYSALDDRGALPEKLSISGDKNNNTANSAKGIKKPGKSQPKKSGKKSNNKSPGNNKATTADGNNKNNNRANNTGRSNDNKPAPVKNPEPEEVSGDNEEKPAESRTSEPEDAGGKKPAPAERREDYGKVAIIIDDFGNNMRNVDDFCNMDIPITFAVLPYLKYSKQISRQATASGKAVVLHLPLENSRGINPGPGTLKTDMKRDEMIKEFNMDLSFVPGAEGFNNHEGSLATEDKEMMNLILSRAKEKGLFFIDSMTSSKSVGLKVAGELGVPALRRNVFLDNEDDIDYISGQLEQLADVAIRDGSAIGIGHVRANTYKAIAKMIPKMQEQGVEFVFVRDLVR